MSARTQSPPGSGAGAMVGAHERATDGDDVGSSPVPADAEVLACLPQGLYRLRVGTRQVTASLSVDAARYGLAPIVGDRVRVRCSPLDPARGVIVERAPIL